MDIVGHLSSCELSESFDLDHIYGSGIVELMYPNFMHCHDWIYQKMWRVEEYLATDPAAALIQAHMICDWVIHYGSARTDVKTRTGWAFKVAEVAGDRASRFFSESHQMGLRVDARSSETLTEKERHDYEHSMVEYAADVMLAERHISLPRMRGIKKGIMQLGERHGYGSVDWAEQLFLKYGIWSDTDLTERRESMRRFVEDAQSVDDGGEFAARTAARKYGIRTDPDGLRYVRKELEAIASMLDMADLRSAIQEAAGAIRDPSSIYTGDWKPIN